LDSPARRSIHLPHRFVTNTVAYTGTHDNDTTRGWWEHGATETEKAAVRDYLGVTGNDVVWPLIRATASSVADSPSIRSRTSSNSAAKPA